MQMKICVEDNSWKPEGIQRDDSRVTVIQGVGEMARNPTHHLAALIYSSLLWSVHLENDCLQAHPHVSLNL